MAKLRRFGILLGLMFFVNWLHGEDFRTPRFLVAVCGEPLGWVARTWWCWRWHSAGGGLL
jgi:hypothetical protein